MPRLDTVDEGVTVYDRDRVEDVRFSQPYFKLVEKAAQVSGQNNRPRDIFNVYRGRHRRRIDPMEFMLPEGVDPHGPVLHIAKACIDVTQGYGINSIVSVDTAKASRFARATDLAIDKISRQQREGLLGFAVAVVRHEDRPNTAHEDRLEGAVNGTAGTAETISEDEAERLARVERLTRNIADLDVPAMILVTLEPGEPPDLGTTLSGPAAYPTA